MKNRSVAIVVRDGKILMERLCYPDANNGKEFFSIPGGGIEDGETPEEAVIRELKEECGMDGTIEKPLAVLFNVDLRSGSCSEFLRDNCGLG